MRNLKTGQFYGTTNETIQLEGITLTDTEYTHDKVDWHYHENAYFTFILEGKVIEGNKKEIYDCTAGSLLFHNWQEAHYNIKPPGFTRGFQIELVPEWFTSFDINPDAVNGSINVTNPQTKMLMYNIFKESKLVNGSSQFAIDALLIQLFGLMAGEKQNAGKKKPAWADEIKDVLNDTGHEWKMKDLAAYLNIHPVHLSRDFTKYFNCNPGDYVRAIKVQRAFSLLPDMDYSLTDIAMRCGFADQSHFIRSFKALQHVSPLQYRRLLKKG